MACRFLRYNPAMHIAFDARMPAYREGGISQYVRQLLPALAAVDGANHYTVLQSRKQPGSLGPTAPNFRHARLLTPPHHRLERWALGLELELWGQLQRRRPDVLHSPDFIPPALGARHRVITVHDLSFLHYPEHLTAESRRYYNDQIGWAVREADAISADSEQTRQDLIAMAGAPPEKVRTIYLAANPIYRDQPNPLEVAATLTRYGLAPGYLLFVGTLEPRKNVPALLRAYRLLRDETGFGEPLLLAGGRGWLYEEIFAAVESLRLRDTVRHLSDVDDRTLAHLYHGAALLALPSHYEGFGLPVLEAMHCGCPVVASDRGSLREVAGDAALLLPPDDVTAWAGGMAHVMQDNTLRRRMIDAGCAQAARFSWERTARETVALYQEVAP
jgi:glycosyltransferase involved in cell wall biosynthesis